MNTAEIAKAIGWDSGEVVARQKDIKWIVQDFIATDSIAWIYGAPGSYKSFAALDIAMSVATGTPWQGREVSQGAVLFIAAEGGDDIHIRRAAWAHHHQADGLLKIVDARPQIDSTEKDDYEFSSTVYRSGIGQLKQTLKAIKNPLDAKRKLLAGLDATLSRTQCAYDEAKVDYEETKAAKQPLGYIEGVMKETAEALETAQVERDEIASLVEALEQSGVEDALKPKLVVIDTFAATASDDTKDAVNRYTRNLYTALKREIPGAAFLVIDHTTKGGDTWMGSQAKLGNPDMVAAAESQGNLLTISMDGGRGKMKRGAAFRPIYLQMKPVELPEVDAYGRKLSTLVCADGRKAKRLAELSGGDSAGAALLAILNAADEPMSRDELRDTYTALPTNEGKKADSVGRAYRRALKQLTEDRLISEDNELLSPCTE